MGQQQLTQTRQEAQNTVEALKMSQKDPKGLRHIEIIFIWTIVIIVCLSASECLQSSMHKYNPFPLILTPPNNKYLR